VANLLRRRLVGWLAGWHWTMALPAVRWCCVVAVAAVITSKTAAAATTSPPATPSPPPPPRPPPLVQSLQDLQPTASDSGPVPDNGFNVSALASFHPIVPGLLGDDGLQGDTCGGLYHSGSWHLFVTVGATPGSKPPPGPKRRFSRGTWAHLKSTNLVDFEAMVDPNEPMGGTGGVAPLPDGGVGSWFNDLPQVQDMNTHQAVMGISRDPELRTWETANVSYVLDLNRSYRDTARPIQSKDGTWWQMIGCDTGGRGAIACAPRVCNAAVCQFRATDTKLNRWTYQQALFTFGKTLLGQPFSFGEVPDFFPLTSAAGKTRHVLTVCAVNKPCTSVANCSCAKDGCMANGGWNAHNVEYVVGEWSDDGLSFKPLQRGVLDFGHWYAARTVAGDNNRGRRLIIGNIRSDITQGKLPIAAPESLQTSDSSSDGGGFNGGPNFFTSLPRELQLTEDDRLKVTPPKELEALRLGEPIHKTVRSLKCGQRLPIGFSGKLLEVAVTLTYPSGTAAEMTGQAGFSVLSDSVFVGYEVQTKRFIVNASASTTPPADWGSHKRFQRAVSAPNITLDAASHSVGFRTLLDISFLETFEDRGRAVITSITAPAADSADDIGLYFDCVTSGSVSPRFDITAWRLRPAPVNRVPVRIDTTTILQPLSQVLHANESWLESGRTSRLKSDDGPFNFTTVFHAGEEGFGCVRYPQVHNVHNDSLYVFVECYNRSGDHCDATGIGFPFAENCHAWGNVCYKKSRDKSGRSWGPLRVVPVNRSGTMMWARGHSTLYLPSLKRLCLHYNGGDTHDGLIWGNHGLDGPPGGTRHQQCLDLQTQQWSEPQDLSKDIGPECNAMLGSRMTNVVLPSGRQLWSQWSFGSISHKGNEGRVCVYATDDDGATFHTTTILHNTAPGALVYLPESRSVYFNAMPPCPGCRANRARVDGYSTDEGSNFTLHLNSGIPLDPVGDAVPGPLLEHHGQLIFALPLGNGSRYGGHAINHGDRLNMAVHSSPDSGKTWTRQLQVSGGYGGYAGLSTLPDDEDSFGLAFEADPAPGSACTGACTVRFTPVQYDF
jgi:sucrose-6-phosphate hydrolase SacC (GH32 family)